LLLLLGCISPLTVITPTTKRQYLITCCSSEWLETYV
jgi:hypothetical protein